MIKEILYEQQGVSDSEAEIISLKKNNFSKVNSGDLIAEVETSKAIIEIHATIDGYVKYFFSLNDIVRAGDKIAEIATDTKEFSDDHIDLDLNKASDNVNEKFISAKALKTASSLNISKKTLEANNIFTVKDIHEYAKKNIYNQNSLIDSSSIASYSLEKPSKSKLSEIENLRRAQNHTLQCSCSIVIEDFEINSFSEKNNLYFNNLFPVLADICSEELRNFKNLNGFFSKNNKYLYNEVNIGFTIDNKDYLQVPVVHNCEKYNKDEIQDAFIELLKLSITQKISITEISKPTFVISDLSTIGDCFFHVPLLAPYTSAILGIALDNKVNRLVMTLSYDHQMSSGKEALNFLEAVRNKLLN